MKQKILIVLMTLIPMSFLACDPENNTFFPVDDGNLITPDSPIYNETVTKNIEDFVQTHFPAYTIVFVKNDYDDGQLQKEIYLKNGNRKNYKIVFDSNDNWIEVDGDDDNNLAIPESVMQLLPQGISTYINTNYKNASIYEIEKKYNYYKIDIEKNWRDFELYFDLNGNFMYLDN
ncbi:MAG: PepSY-like domain-containing protein [Bacteroidales bacterium]|jgi:hypothetical protein|nr:PepSY-like domain-containing protein [Bacteroidales bacterium]